MLLQHFDEEKLTKTTFQKQTVLFFRMKKYVCYQTGKLPSSSFISDLMCRIFQFESKQISFLEQIDFDFYSPPSSSQIYWDEKVAQVTFYRNKCLTSDVPFSWVFHHICTFLLPCFYQRFLFWYNTTRGRGEKHLD